MASYKLDICMRDIDFCVTVNQLACGQQSKIHQSLSHQISKCTSAHFLKFKQLGSFFYFYFVFSTLLICTAVFCFHQRFHIRLCISLHILQSAQYVFRKHVIQNISAMPFKKVSKAAYVRK